jgi:hypothetical protein
MSKSRPRKGSSTERTGGSLKWVAIAGATIVVAVLVYFFITGRDASRTADRTSSSGTATPTPLPSKPASAPQPAGEPSQTMEVAKAVMVTVELDFGPKVPTIAQALNEIERRYLPDDGAGRTFAVLDAYGEPTPEGKLHISMHVSSEKPGLGSLVFKRTGEVLWQTRISPTSVPAAPKNLLILVDGGGGGKGFTVDGSNNPASVLNARAKELNVLVRDAWRDGEEREVTFIYSACGCPVKVMVKRVGDRTTRTKDLPVMFPDDPAAVATISRLMRW